MRHQARSYAIQGLYQADLLKSKSTVHSDRFLEQLDTQDETREFARNLIEGTLQHRKHIDRRLRHNLDRWKLNRLSVVVRNILRLAAFELCYLKQSTHQVVINEAIELCKDYVDNSSHGLVNSVLQKLHDENEGIPEKSASADGMDNPEKIKDAMKLVPDEEVNRKVPLRLLKPEDPLKRPLSVLPDRCWFRT